MKFILKNIFIFMLFAILISSCTKEEIFNNPEIGFVVNSSTISQDSIIDAGSMMQFQILAYGNNLNITNFLVKTVSDTTYTLFDTAMNAPSLDWTGRFFKNLKEEETWYFIVRDRLGNSDSISLQINKSNTSNFNTLVEYNDIVLGAQNNTNGSFLSLNPNMIYSLDEARNDISIQQNIGLIYYFEPIEDKNTIASPGSNVEEGIFEGNLQDWVIRNTSRFLQAEFDVATYSSLVNDSLLISDYIEEDAKRKAKNLSPGNIYLFKNHESKLGIFKVNEVTGTDAGTISISIKIQE